MPFCFLIYIFKLRGWNYTRECSILHLYIQSFKQYTKNYAVFLQKDCCFFFCWTRYFHLHLLHICFVVFFSLTSIMQKNIFHFLPPPFLTPHNPSTILTFYFNIWKKKKCFYFCVWFMIIFHMYIFIRNVLLYISYLRFILPLPFTSKSQNVELWKGTKDFR